MPKEAYRIGLAGVIPYLATSTATVVCSFELASAHESSSGTGFLLDAHTAEYALHILEPLQVGYGAAVSSLALYSHFPQTDTAFQRSCPSSAPSTGALNGPATVAPKATHAT